MGYDQLSLDLFADEDVFLGYDTALVIEAGQAHPPAVVGAPEGEVSTAIGEAVTSGSRAERAESVLMALLRDGRAMVVSWSAGKDSSATLNLLLSAAAKLTADGVVVPPIVVNHVDTLIENPEMVAYAVGEMQAIRAYAAKHRLPLELHTAAPSLNDQWVVRVLSGRALPSFQTGNRDCTTDFKITPLERLRKQVFKTLKANDALREEPVSLIGTRFDESVTRGRNMTSRGESDIELRRGVGRDGKPSGLYLSPIAYWSSDDVWEYLGMARAGAIDAYSNFDDTFRVYADAMATSCAVVAEDMSKAMKASKACGARHGCSLCTVVEHDQSMTNMLTQPQYAYMRGLNDLRNFLTNTRWDLTRRNWLGRTINDGYIRIGPDTYSPGMLEELLRYALTIDVNEKAAASRLGIHPRFQLVSIQQLIAIDAIWSLQALHKPFHALQLYAEVYAEGLRFPVPSVPVFAKPEIFPERYLYVGADWDEGDALTYTGLRSAVHELVSADSACMGTRLLRSGKEVLDIQTGDMLEVDAESAYLFLDFELDRMLERHASAQGPSTEAYMYYVSTGLLQVKAGMESQIDAMLRRSSFKARNGYVGQIDPATVWNRALTKQEVDEALDKHESNEDKCEDEICAPSA